MHHTPFKFTSGSHIHHEGIRNLFVYECNEMQIDKFIYQFWLNTFIRHKLSSLFVGIPHFFGGTCSIEYAKILQIPIIIQLTMQNISINRKEPINWSYWQRVRCGLGFPVHLLHISWISGCTPYHNVVYRVAWHTRKAFNVARSIDMWHFDTTAH